MVLSLVIIFNWFLENKLVLAIVADLISLTKSTFHFHATSVHAFLLIPLLKNQTEH